MSERDTHIRTQAVRHMVEARRRFEGTPNEVFSRFDCIAAAIRERLFKIESLLREGRDSEAILLASVGAWADRTRNKAFELDKANFNPDEPRDDRTKEWTKLGDESDNAQLEDVQYRGHFHDVVVDDFLKSMDKVGAKTAKNVGVLGLNGVLAIPDGAVLPAGGQKSYFVEVKTGFDPPFTRNQQAVYPLICAGYHATSFDPGIANVGLKPGALLPPRDILVVYASGPEQPLRFWNYCQIIGMR